VVVCFVIDSSSLGFDRVRVLGERGCERSWGASVERRERDSLWGFWFLEENQTLLARFVYTHFGGDRRTEDTRRSLLITHWALFSFCLKRVGYFHRRQHERSHRSWSQQSIGTMPHLVSSNEVNAASKRDEAEVKTFASESTSCESLVDVQMVNTKRLFFLVVNNRETKEEDDEKLLALVESLGSNQLEICYKAARALKNAAIGSKVRKSILIKLGAFER